MASLPGIILRIGANTKDAIDGINKVEGRLGKFGNAAKAAFVGIAAGFTLDAVKDQIGQAISAASDLNESMGKVNVVFGDSARDIVEWSKTSAKSLLLSQQAALESVGTFGNLFQAFGLTRDKSAEMSKTLVQLAADLASFNNTSVDDALEALRSGISGEAEPLKRYGVALTDVRLRAEAMAQGIYDGKGVLDVAQKAQASYALILKDTALAQGDVKRTASGWANTTRAISAAFQDAQAEIGGGFLSAIQDVSKAVGGPDGLVDQMDAASESASHFVVGLGAGLRGSIDLAQQLSDALPGQDAASSIWDWATRFTAGAGGSTAIRAVADAIGAVTDAGEANEKAMERQAVLAESFAQDQKDIAAQHTAVAAHAYAAAHATERLGEAGATAGTAAADGIKKIEVGAVNAKTALQRLQEGLDGIFSSAGSFGKAQEKFAQGIAWTQLLAQGPGKSGSAGTGKNQTAVSTKDDFLNYANQVVSQAVATAKTLGPKAANKLLQNAQDRVTQLLKQAGYDNPRAQAAALIGPINTNPNPRPWEQMYRDGSKTNVDPSRVTTRQRNTTSRANSRSAQRSAKTNARP